MVAVFLNELQSGEKMHSLPKTPRGNFSPFIYLFFSILASISAFRDGKFAEVGGDSRKEGYLPSPESVREI